MSESLTSSRLRVNRAAGLPSDDIPCRRILCITSAAHIAKANTHPGSFCTHFTHCISGKVHINSRGHLQRSYHQAAEYIGSNLNTISPDSSQLTAAHVEWLWRHEGSTMHRMIPNGVANTNNKLKGYHEAGSGVISPLTSARQAMPRSLAQLCGAGSYHDGGAPH